MENIKEIEGKLCDLWNKHRAAGMPKAMASKRNQTLRLRRLKVRWEDHPDFDVWEKVFKYLSNSPWYAGHNDQGWVATFSWLCQPGKFDPLVERSAGVALDEDIASVIDDALAGRDEAI